NIDHTVRVAQENLDIVRGIKAHAEIGGQSRWGLEGIKTGREIARQTGLPLYIHLGQLWPSVEEGPVPEPDERIREMGPIMEPGPRASLHTPSRRLCLQRRPGASDRVRGDRSRRARRCRSWLAF